MPKLVRDRVPRFFPGSRYRVLEAAEYERALRAKLEEEVREYLTDRTPEELADGLEALRARKEAERGGFAGQIWLEGVLGDMGKTNAR